MRRDEKKEDAEAKRLNLTLKREIEREKIQSIDFAKEQHA